jgi:hypothetical protein
MRIRTVKQELEYAVRKAIAHGIEPHEVTEIVRELTEAYEQHADPSVVATEDLESE